ncbi:MAG: site-2 protease family protein [Planctomycetaceae bacterium]|jgi:Zn-dependent protease|nr:site-2 protease family protein [Planctomycetaceae bacterium]
MPHRSPLKLWKLALLLYAATWFTTTFCRFGFDDGVLSRFLFAVCLSAAGVESAALYWTQFCTVFWHAILFSGGLMFILTCHELGHFIQSRRFRVRSSPPLFLPMPFGAFGTLGAVIAMDEEVPNRRALFDIGISGPLAGLIPSLIFLYFGIKWSSIGPLPGGFEFGYPLLFQWAVYWIYGPLPPQMTLVMHPIAMAAWAGLLLTSINLMPFSQLDGGHVFYAMLGNHSYPAVKIIFTAVLIAVCWYQLWHWSLLLLLIVLAGIQHPPVRDGKLPISWFRCGLGWATLLFVFIGLAPTPLDIRQETPQKPVYYCEDHDNDNRPAPVSAFLFAYREIPAQKLLFP